MARAAIDARDLSAFAREIRTASRRTGRELHDALKDSAKIVADAAREMAGSDKIAATIREGARGGSVYVKAGGPELPIAALREVGNSSTERVLLQSKRSGTFKHPVFAGKNLPRSEWTWVDQPMHPYLGPAALLKQEEAVERLAEGVNRVLESTVHAELE